VTAAVIRNIFYAIPLGSMLRSVKNVVRSDMCRVVTASIIIGIVIEKVARTYWHIHWWTGVTTINVNFERSRSFAMMRVIFL
jgi:NAD(P)H-nitrite reductase large subunit